MDDIKMVAKDGEPNPEDFQALSEGMLDYHAAKGHPRKSEKYSIFLKDEKDKTLGGVVVTFLWNGMEIDSLWVDESIRGKGWGKKLMEEVEKEGIKRGSTVAYTNTFPWQAPEFYEKLGYSMYGKLEDFPKGSALSYYSKKLE